MPPSRSWHRAGVSFTDGLPRRWISIQVPGTGSAVLPATYVVYDKSPTVPEGVDDWAWLRSGSMRDDGYMATPCENAVCDLSDEALRRVLGTDAPDDLHRFVADPSLRRRMWSATDSYFDLGHFAQAVDGGRLLHVVSDSQWVMHWSLFLGDGGEEAVIASPFPSGFSLDSDDLEFYAEEPVWSLVCADTFAEFTWRWWMDNEIFRHVELDHLPLSEPQLQYVAQYADPQLLG